MPLGLVRFDGPGDTRLTARVRAQGDAKLLSIVSGSGRIGENIVRPKNVSGELTWRKGAMTGSITINLPEHVKVSRTWAQEVTVTAQPQGCDWAAIVALQARGEGASLDLRGPLTESGSYVLRGSGSVSISRTKVPVTGFLRATAPGRSASTTWRVEGSTPRLVRIPGARLSGVRVALGNVVPIVRGTASLRLDAPLLTAPAILEVAGANTWSAQVNGSNRRLWIVPQTDQVVVRTSELKGSVGMRAGQPHWTLTAPGAARIGTLDYNVDVGFDGRLSYTVQARGAVGTFLGLSEQRPFLGVPTKLTITPKGITGALTVVTRGELLLDMPGMWRGTTDYILRPVAGQGWTFDTFISHALRSGKGAIRLTGPVSPTGAVELIGSGDMEVSGTNIPVRGFYKRRSFVGGIDPVWALAGYPAEAEGGRIPLKGGAGFVGGRFDFKGVGAQPASTIPEPTSTSSVRPSSASVPRSTPVVSGGQTLTTVAYDGFAYPPGPLTGAKGGTGWLNAWASTSSAGGTYQVQSPPMTYPNLTTTGGSVIWGSGGNEINGFGRTLPTMSSGVVYVQFLSNFGSQSGSGTPQMRLVNSGATGLQGSFGNNGGPNMAILDGNGNALATTSAAMNANLMTVVRIDYSAKTTSMWINPNLSTFDYANPPAPAAQAKNFAPAFNQIDPYTRSGQYFDEITVMTLNPAPAPSPATVTVTGTTTVQLSDSDDDTFYLPVTYDYTDPDNWTATAAGTTPSNLYNPFTGLEVPETDFSGTITDTAGTETWDVSIAMQDWQDMAQGVDYMGAFTISNTCPLADQSNCPDSEGIFIGGQATVDFDDPDFPTASSEGAFLTDLSWGWWDATAAGSISINGITMSNPDLTIWRGSGTGPNSDIVMPDLSDLNGNGMNLEFCADFTVPVPYVTTVNTLGCAVWSEEGAIMAQVNTGGSVATGDYNGVTVNSTTLTSYVWNGIDQTETVFVNGVEIDAEYNKNYITADIVIPGNAMHDFGTGSSTDTVITATGWFDAEGNFDIEGTIPVNLKGGGFTLEDILITISKEKEDDQTTFDLRFDAECDVVINGNHFPLDVYIGYQKQGDSTITVGLSATGVQSTQPEGTMDFVNLVPSGDFEPENANLVDGSFDGRLPANIPNDGGFERSTNPGDIVVDGDFETGTGANALPDGDFESGAFGNMLANADFEDTNLLVNGGFEDNGGSLWGWTVINQPFTVVSGSAVGPDDTGNYVGKLMNPGISNNNWEGPWQYIQEVDLNGATADWSMWVTSATSGSTSFEMEMTGLNCSTFTQYKNTQTVTSSSWVEMSVGGAFNAGCTGLLLSMYVTNLNTGVLLDAGEVNVTTVSGTAVPAVWRPSVVGTFDSLSTTPLMSGYSSSVAIASDVPGTLQTNGSSSWMTTSSAGSTGGSFDISYSLMFPTGTSSREIADFGFWLDGNYSTMNGYCFRLQTGNGDGGFFKCSKTTKTFKGNSYAPDVTRGDWYQVRIISSGQQATAYVTNTTTGAFVFTDTINLSSPYGGYFGQVPDGTSTSQGIRWDDLTYYWLENKTLTGSPGTAQPSLVWFDTANAHSGSGGLSLYSNSISGQSIQYSTGEAPVQGATYSYSAWIRAASGTVNGSINLAATGSPGSTAQKSSQSFSVGTTWTEVQVTLTNVGAGYTDLRPGITLSAANVELYVDDQVLQQVPFQYNSGTSLISVTDDEAHSGTNSLEIINASNSAGSNAFYTFSQLPAPGSVFTASAWVLSPAGVSGVLDLSEQAGSTSQRFTGTGTWQQVSVTRTMQGGSYWPNFDIEIDSGHQGQSLYVDDVSVVVSKISSSQSGYVGAPTAPAGWLSSTDTLPTNIAPASARAAQPRSWDPTAPSSITATVNGGTVSLSWTAASSVNGIYYYKVETASGADACPYVTGRSCTVSNLTAGAYAFKVKAYSYTLQSSSWSPNSNTVEVYQDVAPVVVDDPSLAHEGSGALVMQPGAGGTEIDTYTVTPETAPAAGSTWQASLWVASGTSNNSQPVTVTVSAGSSSKSTTVTLSPTAQQYTNVVVSLPVASAATAFDVQISYTDSTGTSPIYIDDLSLTETGLSPADDWEVYAPGGFVAVQGVVDPANAQSGDGYLLLDNTGTQSAAVYLDDTYKPVSGTAHEMSFWVKSPSGTVGNLAAWVRTQDSGGTILDSYQFYYQATTTWQQVFLSLPIKNTSATDIRTEFDLPAGATIWLDGVESRDVNYWSAVQPSSGVASVTIMDNAADAANGQNYLRFVTAGANGGMGDTITTDTDGKAIDVIAGSSYKLEAYVRSSNGSTVSGTMSLDTANGSTTVDSVSVPFTVGGDWTPVQLTLDATKSANTMIPKIVLGGAGMLDVDELTLTPVIIEQSDPWWTTGPGVTRVVVDDPENAYDSSYGVMEFSVSSAGSGMQHSVTQSTTVGEQLSATAFVRTAGADVSGTFQVTSIGGTTETWKQSFTANGDWQSVSIPIRVAQSGHTGFTVSVVLNTTGQTLYLDQVALQTNPWTPTSGAVNQAIVFDGDAAQSGSGYLQLTPTGSGNGSSYLDVAASSDIGGTYAAGTTWVVTTYIRSSSSTSLASGSISLGAAGGPQKSQSFSVGSEWTAVPVSYTVGSSPLSSLRVTATVSGSSVPVAIDSVTISDGTPPPDGITTPLPHPESGWVYLWDEAFGVPGMHLWAISAQVDFEDGDPGLGVSATTYQDPTKMSDVMSGTDWIKGDMAVNISETDPCFLFDFSSDGGNSGVSLGQGVFTASDFAINFAPRGCQVGPYTLTKGASLSFDGELGDGTVNFDIAITEGDDGPEFTEDIGITDITIGGFDFKEMELSILLTETDDSITFVGDMVTPMGNFNGSYDLDANEDGLVMDGSVSLTDWEWAGGGFDVEELDYDMSMTVPFGAGECGSFTSDTSGQMDMAKKTSLSFTGDISMNCGRLEVLKLDYDYKHGSITEVFELDYDASTGILAGEVEFDFDRSTSWKSFFHKYNRHPKFSIALLFSMDVDKPSTASVTLDGTVSVSGGDGSLSCTIEAGSGANWADDQCSLHVHISVGGGHTYNASW